ncbi:MAG: aquaporin [Candidatus Eremiobacteraeota bacterium]|nr:aquaporin [Candidatus Eremiobacteraeota bacterium]
MGRSQYHWIHYVIEAWGLGTFMFVAGAVAVGLDALPQPLAGWIAANPTVGRAMFGCAMGLTAIGIMYSPWGMRSGAHLNPAVTLTFARLGKIVRHDAVSYVLAQFAGGVIGFAVAALLFGKLLLGPPAYAIVTKPGDAGVVIAFFAEVSITFVLMGTVLVLSNSPPRIARYTGLAAGALVALFITFEAPFSGMSMNPARTFASALLGRDWTAIWIYFTAPPLGMLLAALAYVKVAGSHAVLCARISRHGAYPCIFRCSYAEAYEASLTEKRSLR